MDFWSSVIYMYTRITTEFSLLIIDIFYPSKINNFLVVNIHNLGIPTRNIYLYYLQYLFIALLWQMEMNVWKGRIKFVEKHFNIKIWVLKSPKWEQRRH